MMLQFQIGIEISSPPFSDNPEDVAKFRAVLETMQEMGYYYDEVSGNASGQLNIGIDYFNSPLACLIFVETFCNAEEVLYHIANKKGQLIRQSVHCNSRFKPVSEIIGKRMVDEELTWDEVFIMFSAPDKDEIKHNKYKQISKLMYKKNSICLRDRNRFEIRFFNGSTEFDDWKENILLIGKIAEMANRCADVLMLKVEETPEDIKMLELREELRVDNLPLETQLYLLMDLIFKNDAISKQIYIDRFYELEKEIGRTGTDKYYSQKLEPEFGTVEFQGVYKSQIEDGHRIVYDPETDKYEELDGDDR